MAMEVNGSSASASPETFYSPFSFSFISRRHFSILQTHLHRRRTFIGSSHDFFHDPYLLSKRAMKKNTLYLLNKILKKNCSIYFRCIFKYFLNVINYIYSLFEIFIFRFFFIFNMITIK